MAKLVKQITLYTLRKNYEDPHILKNNLLQFQKDQSSIEAIKLFNGITEKIKG